jgi:hypothetical protein
MQTLGEDLVLLSLRPDGRFQKHATLLKVRLALAGSELVQLAAARRVEVVDGRIVVIDPTPTGDQQLDFRLGELVYHRGRRPPKTLDWVAKPRRQHALAYLVGLSAAGVLRPEQRKVLVVLATPPRWPIVDTARAAVARARLDAIVLSGQPIETIDPLSAALAGLVHAIGLDEALYPRAEQEPARRRLKQLAKRDPAARAVHNAVAAATYAAVDSAVGSAVDAAVHASVHATQHAAAHHGGAGGHGGHHDGGGGGGHH